jgi:hypothetical protein
MHLIGQLFAVNKQAKDVSVTERLALRQTQSVPVVAELRTQVADLKRKVIAEAHHGGSAELNAQPMRN